MRSETELCSRLFELLGVNGVLRIDAKDRDEHIMVSHTVTPTEDGDLLVIGARPNGDARGRSISVTRDKIAMDTIIEPKGKCLVGVQVVYSSYRHDRWSDEYNESIGYVNMLCGLVEEAIANEHS